MTWPIRGWDLSPQLCFLAILFSVTLKMRLKKGKGFIGATNFSCAPLNLILESLPLAAARRYSFGESSSGSYLLAMATIALCRLTFDCKDTEWSRTGRQLFTTRCRTASKASFARGFA